MPTPASAPLQLQDGSRVAVIGGGPAGSFFSYFLLQSAQRLDLKLEVDIYEPRDFCRPGPAGCNMCGGIVSESLVQNLAAEGITLPPGVVQRGIDSYLLHMDAGSVRIATPLRENRIAAIHRGAGPRGLLQTQGGGLDGFLLGLAQGLGARHCRRRVEALAWNSGRPQVKTEGGTPVTYDLLVSAVGINSSALKLFDALLPAYKPPRSTKTYICEFAFDGEILQSNFGSSMHVFLLNLPRLEFAALIPKGRYLTVCMLGEDIDKELVAAFLDSPEVRHCMPAGWQPPQDFCHCSPRISIRSAVRPFADRVVFVGDCGSTRLYKDGIGAAYRTAKAAAITAIFDGISARDFRRHFWPMCAAIARDNQLGKLVFLATRVIQKSRTLRRGLWSMVCHEQLHGGTPRMRGVLWDTFTGSAPYSRVFLRALHPAFLGRLLWETARTTVPNSHTRRRAA